MNSYLLLSTLFFGQAACIAAVAKPMKQKQYVMEGVKLNLPPEMFTTKTSPGPDFDIYTFKSSDVVILQVYAGLNPEFPSESAPANNVRTIEINRLLLKNHVWTDSMGISRECLLDMRKYGTHTILHFYYNHLNAHFANVADKILSTLEKK